MVISRQIAVILLLFPRRKDFKMLIKKFDDSEVSISRHYTEENITILHCKIKNSQFKFNLVIVIDRLDYSHNEYYEMHWSVGFYYNPILQSVISKIIDDLKSHHLSLSNNIKNQSPPPIKNRSKPSSLFHPITNPPAEWLSHHK